MSLTICKTAPECDGFFCGSNIIKNSIPADRLELDSFKELFRNYCLNPSRKTGSWNS